MFNRNDITCICDPPVMRMDCPAHSWYFKRMRELPMVCENPPRKEKAIKIKPEFLNRKARRKGKKR